MKLFLAGVALIALAAPTLAQDAPPPPPPPGAPMMHGHGGPGGPGHMRPPSRDEVMAMVAKHFAEMDTNHDGVVTQAEFDAARAKRRAMFEARMKEHRDRMFDRLDTNKDGKLTRAEFDAPPPHGGPDGGPDGHKRRGGPDGPPPGGPDGPPPGDREGKGPMGRHHGMGPMAGGMGMPMRERWFERADADHDGKVTLAEAQAAAGKMYDRFFAHREGGMDHGEGRGGGRTGTGYDLPATPPAPPAPPALPRT